MLQAQGSPLHGMKVSKENCCWHQDTEVASTVVGYLTYVRSPAIGTFVKGKASNASGRGSISPPRIALILWSRGIIRMEIGPSRKSIFRARSTNDLKAFQFVPIIHLRRLSNGFRSKRVTWWLLLTFPLKSIAGFVNLFAVVTKTPPLQRSPCMVA